MKNKIMWKDITLIVSVGSPAMGSWSPYFFYVQNTYTQTVEQKTVLTKSGAESPACHTERKEYRFRIKTEQRRKYHR